MSFWSGEKLEEEVKNCILGDYDTDNIDCASYTLHIGPEVFITPDQYETNPNQNTKRSLKPKEPFNIPSGQFAFLITDEEINISEECIAFISMKATTKFKGLVNVSGFHVDPGYKGRLVFSVFNAGPMPIKLQQGMPLFLLWIADLDRPTKKKKSGNSVKDLSLKIIEPIHGPIFSPQEISSSVREFKNDMNQKFNLEREEIRKEISDHKEKISSRLTRIYVIFGVATAIIIILLYPFLKGNLNEYLTSERKNVTHSSLINKNAGSENKEPNTKQSLPKTNDPKIDTPKEVKK